MGNQAPRIDNAIGEVAKFITHLRNIKDLELDRNQSPIIGFSIGEKGGFELTGAEAESYYQCLNNLHVAASKNDIISRREVERLLQEEIATVFHDLPDDTGSFEVRLRSCKKRLREALSRKPDSWTVLRVVKGVDPSGLPLNIGNVRFCQATPNFMRNIIRRVDEILATNNSSDEVVKAYRLRLKESMSKFIRDHVIAHVDVVAIDGVAADANGEREIRLAIDVLNFYADLLHGYGLGVQVRLAGETESEIEYIPKFRNGANQSYFESTQVCGPRGKLLVQRKNRKEALRLGFANISRMLARDVRTSLEERIISSFHWAGRATVSKRRDEAFLLYAIALESLLLPKSNLGEIQFRLKVRCAHVLGISIEAKEAISRAVGQLYGLRSEIVHKGSTDVAESDVRRLRHLVKNCLIAMITESEFLNLDSEDALEAWFSRKLLG